MKQSKLRRKRVFRYAVLYFVMLVVFVGLIVGPVFAGSKVGPTLDQMLPSNFKGLAQPVNLSNNDTRGETQTGTAIQAATGAATGAATDAATGAFPTETGLSKKIKLF